VTVGGCLLEETILSEFTIDDLATYTEPWGAEIPMKADGRPTFRVRVS